PRVVDQRDRIGLQLRLECDEQALDLLDDPGIELPIALGDHVYAGLQALDELEVPGANPVNLDGGTRDAAQPLDGGLEGLGPVPTAKLLDVGGQVEQGRLWGVIQDLPGPAAADLQLGEEGLDVGLSVDRDPDLPAPD